ncbi:hypothetical protein SDC9_158699 [bioreactor metagenome]|uniref:Uncharacterized protein n=1 Tax=bioreactor metagenome TaxID=1076179 RepID=A0A645FAJ8_9ZZZZ
MPSTVCIRLGLMASRISTVMAPATPRSSAVTASPARLMPMTILPSRSRISLRLVVSARMAMISEATVISKPVSLVKPFSSGPLPISTPRKKRSEVSITRRQVIVSGSISRRHNLRRSSGVRSSGSAAVMPSFSRRASMPRVK